MRTLVVYYSRTGTTKKVAESIAQELGADIEEITENRGRSGVFGFLRSGMEAYTRRLAKINKAIHDPSRYDLVLVGSPVWSSNMSSPVRTYIVQNKQGFRGVGFFVTSGDKDVNPKVFSELEGLVAMKPVSVMNLSTSQVKENKHSEKLQAFLVGVRQAA